MTPSMSQRAGGGRALPTIPWRMASGKATEQGDLFLSIEVLLFQSHWRCLMRNFLPPPQGLSLLGRGMLWVPAWSSRSCAECSMTNEAFTLSSTAVVFIPTPRVGSWFGILLGSSPLLRPASCFFGGGSSTSTRIAWSGHRYQNT